MTLQACLNPDPAKRKTCAELMGMTYMAEVRSLLLCNDSELFTDEAHAELMYQKRYTPVFGPGRYMLDILLEHFIDDQHLQAQ